MSQRDEATLREVIAEALRASTFDCHSWSLATRLELANHLIARIQRGGYHFYQRIGDQFHRYDPSGDQS
jgi:hypothetical protein